MIPRSQAAVSLAALLSSCTLTPSPRGTLTRVRDLPLDRLNWDLNAADVSLSFYKMELCTLGPRLPLRETGRTERKDRDGDDSSGSWTVVGGGGAPGVGETQLCDLRRSKQIPWASVSPSVKAKSVG